MINFWEESFWLPSNISWKDLENGPNKEVIYGSIQDFWVQVPLVIFIFVLRHICEKYLFKPIGKCLNISDGNRRKAPENYILETHYRKSTKLKDLSKISKKLDMSERAIQRWWRLRRSQDKPSPLVKFCENMWKGSFYLCKECYGVSVLWRKEWLWNIYLCFDGYPHHGITNDLKWDYMISLAFYWSLTISQFYDVRRKDFWQMCIHHIATIVLLTCSWICNLHRLGALVLHLHDCSDIFLELAKAAKYARAETLVNTLFGLFVFVWTSTRLYAFPVLVLFRIFVMIQMNKLFYFHMYISLFILLCFLMILNVFWTWMIAKLLFKVLFCGEATDDVRSSCSETSSTDVESSKEHNNNKLKHN